MDTISFMRRPAAVVLAVFLFSCSGPEPLQGIDLPPASMPDEFETSGYAVQFVREFDAGAWSLGEHSYTMALDCPETGFAPFRSGEVGFTVNEAAQLFREPVYLRLTGQSRLQTGGASAMTIHPEQTTAAVISLIGITEEGATASADCVAELVMDTGDTYELLPGEPFRA